MIVDNTIFIGKIKRLHDREESVIIFEIPHIIDEGKAYAMFKNRIPNEGEEVMLFKLDSTTGSMWYYLAISQGERLTLESDEAGISIDNGGTGSIYIESKNRVIISHHGVQTKPEQGGFHNGEGFEVGVYGNRLGQWLSFLIQSLMGIKIDTPSGLGVANIEFGSNLNQLYNNINNILYPQLRLDDEDANEVIF